MTDIEVSRLRKLRNTALKTRAIAAALDSPTTQGRSLFSQSAQSCWQIARTITGRLRAHPYPSFQRGPSEARAAWQRASAVAVGAIAQYRRRSFKVYSNELRRLARELDDARALTLSPDLSDDLGRLQGRIRRLQTELDVAIRAEAGSDGNNPARLEARPRALPSEGGAAEGWPYLNI